MAFKDLFKDNNDINEKSVVGFASFIVMIIFAVVDIVTGVYGKEIIIQDYIYNSFVIITIKDANPTTDFSLMSLLSLNKSLNAILLVFKN